MNLENIKPDIRHLKDMKNVVYDQEWFKTAPEDLELYYMYRGLKEKDNLRYDITIIPPRMLGKEYVKTKGHNHPEKEEYIVLEGEAIFLIQDGKEIIKDVYAVKAKKGDKVIIPPEYDGHVTINPTNQELKLANWIAKDFKHDYSVIERMKGASYFYTTDGWIKNKNYKQVPELRFDN